jgi:hypothetical protein
MPRRREAARDLGFVALLSHLEIELQSELDQARVARLQYLAEG